jgi:hypothetical protein
MAQQHYQGNKSENEAQAKAEADALYKDFERWRADQDAFAKMLNPEPDGDREYGISKLITATNKEGADRAKSQFISEWAGTRSEAKIARLTMAQTVIETAMIQDDDAELIQSADFEDLLHGILAGFDDDTQQQWLDISYDRMMKSFITFTGKSVTRVGVSPKTPGSNVMRIRSDILDPYQCAHTFGPGKRRFLYRFTRPIGEARAMLPGLIDATMPAIMEKKDDDLVTIDDYWVEEMDPENPGMLVVTNTLLIDGLSVHPAGYRETAFDRLAFQIVNISSQARLPVGNQTQSSRQEWVRYHARPFFARARYTLPLYEDILALRLDEMAQVIHPSRYQKNPNNPGQFVIDPATRTPGSEHLIDEDARIELEQVGSGSFSPDSVTPEIKAVLNSIMSDLLVTGQFPRDTSGYLYNSAIQQGELVLAPEARAAASNKKQVLEEGIRQFLAAPKGSVVHVSFISPMVDPENPRAFKMNRYKQSDIPKDYDMMVLEPPMLPRDPLQAMSLFERGVNSGAWDKITGRTEALKMRDPIGVERRQERQSVRESQEFRRHLILQSYEREIARFRAEAQAAERVNDRSEALHLMTMAGMLEKELVGIMQQHGIATQQSPDVGGIPPEVQPPEMRDNPDEAAFRERNSRSPIPGA